MWSRMRPCTASADPLGPIAARVSPCNGLGGTVRVWRKMKESTFWQVLVQTTPGAGGAGHTRQTHSRTSRTTSKPTPPAGFPAVPHRHTMLRLTRDAPDPHPNPGTHASTNHRSTPHTRKRGGGDVSFLCKNGSQGRRCLAAGPF